MAKDVRIPVKVEGDEQAKQKLKGVQAGVRDVGTAGETSAAGMQQHAAAHEKAGQAAKYMTEQVTKFDRSAKTAALGILAQFNPMLASLAGLVVNVAKGIGGMTKALLGWIGAGAALAGIIWVFTKLRENIAKTREDADRLYNSLAKIREEFEEPQARMIQTLLRFGALTPETEKAVGDMRRRIERAGLGREAAVGVAPLAVMEGLAPQDAILAAYLGVKGARLEKPGDIGRLLGRLRKRHPQILEDARRQLELLKQTEYGKLAAAETEAQPIGAPQLDPIERARRALIREGYQDWEVEGGKTEWLTPRGFRRHVEEAEKVRTQMERFRQERERVAGEPFMPGKGIKLQSLDVHIQRLWDREVKLRSDAVLRTVERERQRDLEALSGPTFPSEAAPLPGGLQEVIERGVQATTIIQNIEQVNTQFRLDPLGVAGRPWQLAPDFVP